jgi:hypothetical protein
MNEELRRYLSEDWDVDEETTEPEREDRPTKRVKAQTRRQQEKVRGKAVAKHLRAIKQQRKNGKP